MEGFKIIEYIGMSISKKKIEAVDGYRIYVLSAADN